MTPDFCFEKFPNPNDIWLSFPHKQPSWLRALNLKNSPPVLINGQTVLYHAYRVANVYKLWSVIASYFYRELRFHFLKK